MSARRAIVPLSGLRRTGEDLARAHNPQREPPTLRLHRPEGGLFLKLLSRLRGVSITGFQVSVSWSPKERPLVSEIFAALDELGERLGEKVVVVLDEFQRSRGSIGVTLHSAIAHSYDFHENLSFLLTGSEMGILYGILRNSENPLYGRAYIEVKTRKLSREEVVDFLEKGFAELNVKVGREAREAPTPTSATRSTC